MPIYEYRCLQCDGVTEVLERSRKGKSPVCSHCGSAKTEKLFSSFSAHSHSAHAHEATSPCGGACARQGRCPLG